MIYRGVFCAYCDAYNARWRQIITEMGLGGADAARLRDLWA